jgi:hypothetical protein
MALAEHSFPTSSSSDIPNEQTVSDLQHSATSFYKFCIFQLPRPTLRSTLEDLWRNKRDYSDPQIYKGDY